MQEHEPMLAEHEADLGGGDTDDEEAEVGFIYLLIDKLNNFFKFIFFLFFNKSMAG